MTAPVHERRDAAAPGARWLRDAGFEHVEVHFKWAEAAIYGGAQARQRKGRD